MSKLVKDLITKELRSRYADVDNAVWVELIGADGNATNEFRRDLHNKQMRLEMVKNSLFRSAVGDGPLGKLAQAINGPTALITGGESAIDAAKVLEDWLPKIKTLKLRGAVLDGEYLDEAAVTGLSKMPTKIDLQAKIAGIVLSPGGNLAGAILSGGGNIAGCLKTLIEKLEQGEDAADAA